MTLMTDVILGRPTEGLPYPHPEAPPAVGQVAVLLYVAASVVLVAGLIVAVAASLVARRRFRQGRELGAAAVVVMAGAVGAVVGGLGMVVVSVFS